MGLPRRPAKAGLLALTYVIAGANYNVLPVIIKEELNGKTPNYLRRKHDRDRF